MAITIDISAGPDGLWTIQDDGNASNGTSWVLTPDGNIHTAFFQVGEAVTILSRPGQDIQVDITDSQTPAAFTIGDLASGLTRPDEITVAQLTASGNVTLTANRSITEWGMDAADDIAALGLMFDAGTGIGSAANAIETGVSLLEAGSVTGGINLANSGSVTIGAMTSSLRGLATEDSGDIILVAQGTINLFDNSGAQTVDSAGNVTLTAVGATADLFSGVNRDTILAAGDIALSAGRDVKLGVGGSEWDNDVRAGGAISIAAGNDVWIDGDAEVQASDGGSTDATGGVSITAGGDILIEDSTGTGASVGIDAGSGAVILTTGLGGTLSLAANSSTAVHASGVTATADRILIDSDSGMEAGSVRITVATAGRNIVLGSATDAAAALELSDAELNSIYTLDLTIGSEAAGQVEVQGDIEHQFAALTLESGTAVSVLADITTPASLTLRSAGVVAQSGASTVTTGALNVFVDSPDLDVAGQFTTFAGTVNVTSSTITGGNDADTLGGTTDDDTVWAGDGFDLVVLANGGNDIAMGEAGNDRFYFGAAMTGADTAVGGAGADSVLLDGTYAGLVMGASSLQGIEIIRLLSGSGAFDYSITMDDGNVGSGQFITINATDLVAGEGLAFNGTAETNGRFVVHGGAGGDTLAGGARNDQLNGNDGIDALYGLPGNDILFGGAGGDALNGGAGRDTMRYTSPAQSSGIDFDQLIRFEPNRDSIDLPMEVTGWTGSVTGGELSISSIDRDLADAVNELLLSRSAVLFAPSSGDFAGRLFAVIDADGNGAYSFPDDYVFEFISPVQPPNMTSAYFI